VRRVLELSVQNCIFQLNYACSRLPLAIVPRSRIRMMLHRMVLKLSNLCDLRFFMKAWSTLALTIKGDHFLKSRAPKNPSGVLKRCLHLAERQDQDPSSRKLAGVIAMNRDETSRMRIIS
jgi:hypothetical protein